MTDGIRTANVLPGVLADFIGNDVNASTRRQGISDVATNIAGQPVIANQFAEIESEINLLQTQVLLANGEHVGRFTLAQLTTDIATIADNAIGEVLKDPVGTTTLRMRAANVATITLSAVHGLSIGNQVNVRDVGGVGKYNGHVTVTAVPTTSSFSYANSGANESSSTETGGNVDRNGKYLKVSGAWVWAADFGELELAARLANVENIIPKIVLRRPIALEGTKALIPELRYWNGVSYDTIATVSGDAYDEYDYADVGASIEAPQMIFYDTLLGTKRSSLVTAFAPGVTKIPIVDSWAGFLKTSHPVSRNVPNLYYRGLNSSGAVRPDPDGLNPTTEVAITNTGDMVTAYALGFRKGYTNSGDDVTCGGYIEQRQRTGYYFGRVFIILAPADTNNNWPEIDLWPSRWDYSATSYTIMSLEKVYSPRMASFITIGKIPIDLTIYPNGYPLDGFYVQTARLNCILFGLQFGMGDNHNIWIGRNDYPEVSPLLPVLGDQEPTLLYGDRICLVEGEKLNLYPQNCHETRTHKAPMYFTTQENTPDTSTVPVVVQASDIQIRLDPAVLNDAAAAKLVVQPVFDMSQRQYRDITIKKTPLSALSGAGTVRIHCIGDSLTQGYEWPRRMKATLTRLGATISMVGTISNSGTMVEARAGTGFRDLIYEDTTQVVPISVAPAISYASYMALNQAGRLLRNPLLRTSTGGDNAAHVRNGQILDFGAYYTGTSIAAPHIILIDLGTNEIGFYSTPSAVYDAVLILLDVVVSRIRAYNATVKIGLIVHNDGVMKESLWARRSSLIKAHMKFVADRADAHLFFIPAYAHMNIFDFGHRTVISTDAITGRVNAFVSDDTHSQETTVGEFGQSVAYCVADIIRTA